MMDKQKYDSLLRTLDALADLFDDVSEGTVEYMPEDHPLQEWNRGRNEAFKWAAKQVREFKTNHCEVYSDMPKRDYIADYQNMLIMEEEMRDE